MGNPGKGGWGAVLLFDEKQVELSGGFVSTTNNRMEYLAAIKALEYVEDIEGVVKIHTDSALLYDTMTKWIHSWKKRNWVKSDKKPVSNLDLVIRLNRFAEKRKIVWVKVPAHTGVKYNEICDQLAGVAATKAIEIDYNYEGKTPPADLSFEQVVENIIKLDAKTESNAQQNNISEKSSDLLVENERLLINVVKKDGKLQLELLSKVEPNKFSYFNIDDIPKFLFTILKKNNE